MDGIRNGVSAGVHFASLNVLQGYLQRPESRYEIFISGTRLITDVVRNGGFKLPMEWIPKHSYLIREPQVQNSLFKITSFLGFVMLQWNGSKAIQSCELPRAIDPEGSEALDHVSSKWGVVQGLTSQNKSFEDNPQHTFPGITLWIVNEENTHTSNVDTLERTTPGDTLADYASNGNFSLIEDDDVSIPPWTFLIPDQDGDPMTINIPSDVNMNNMQILEHVRFVSVKKVFTLLRMIVGLQNILVLKMLESRDRLNASNVVIHNKNMKAIKTEMEMRKIYGLVTSEVVPEAGGGR
ncbi:hypothetical protein LguiA_033618 [Lonicera macranthoides]